jgi:hypothetical protein
VDRRGAFTSRAGTGEGSLPLLGPAARARLVAVPDQTNPSPVRLWLVKTPQPDTLSPRERAGGVVRNEAGMSMKTKEDNSGLGRKPGTTPWLAQSAALRFGKCQFLEAAELGSAPALGFDFHRYRWTKCQSPRRMTTGGTDAGGAYVPALFARMYAPLASGWVQTHRRAARARHSL